MLSETNTINRAELERVIREAGAEPIGPALCYFNDLATGSTLAMSVFEITPATVREHISENRKAFKKGAGQ